MFNQRLDNDQENFDESNFNPADFPPSFLPGIQLEGFNIDFFPRDDHPFYFSSHDSEVFEQSLPFMLDPAVYQTLQEDMKRLIPGFELFTGLVKDVGMPEMPNTFNIPKPPIKFNPGKKIGTISAEERREKVRRFLEKRKRRIFKKRISYACRKRVADSRIRVKGRFVTKEQASVLVTIKKEPDVVSDNISESLLR
jgi:CCT motif